MAAPRVQKKRLDHQDETRDFGEGKMQIATVTDFKVARVLLQPGWKWSEHVKPLAQTESCQVRHTGYVVSGQLKVVMDDDRSEVDLGPGDAYILEPGHDAWVVGNEPFVGVDVSAEMVEQFAKEEEDKGLIDRAKDKLSGQ